MKDYIIGICLTLLVPSVIAYLGSKLIPHLVSWQLKKVHDLMCANTGDIALDTFQKDLVMAVVKLAQAKFSGAGLGPERKKFVVDFLVSKVPLLKGQQDKLTALIDELVAKEKEMLNSIKP